MRTTATEMREQYRDFERGFVKVVDQVPARTIIHEFDKRFAAAVRERFGNIVPNDRAKLLELAHEVVESMEREAGIR